VSAPQFFSTDHIEVIGEASVISEEVLSDYFSLSRGDWRQWPYEIRTLKELQEGEYPGNAFAHLLKYGKGMDDKLRGRDCVSFYRICLNDTNILKKTNGGDKRHLLPFMVYVLVHELFHIVRFGKYIYFPLMDTRREEEEERVSGLTNKILEGVAVPGLREVIDFFSGNVEEIWA